MLKPHPGLYRRHRLCRWEAPAYHRQVRPRFAVPVFRSDIRAQTLRSGGRVDLDCQLLILRFPHRRGCKELRQNLRQSSVLFFQSNRSEI